MVKYGGKVKRLESSYLEPVFFAKKYCFYHTLYQYLQAQYSTYTYNAHGLGLQKTYRKATRQQFCRCNKRQQENFEIRKKYTIFVIIWYTFYIIAPEGCSYD